MERNIFVVSAPTEKTPGRYMLLLSRGTMMGVTTSAFGVDGVTWEETEGQSDRQPVLFKGVLFNETGGIAREVVAFPAGTAWTMVDRDLVEQYTPIQMAKRQQKEHTALEKLFEAGRKNGEVTAPGPDVGQYL